MAYAKRELLTRTRHTQEGEERRPGVPGSADLRIEKAYAKLLKLKNQPTVSKVAKRAGTAFQTAHKWFSRNHPEALEVRERASRSPKTQPNAPESAPERFLKPPTPLTLLKALKPLQKPLKAPEKLSTGNPDPKYQPLAVTSLQSKTKLPTAQELGISTFIFRNIRIPRSAQTYYALAYGAIDSHGEVYFDAPGFGTVPQSFQGTAPQAINFWGEIVGQVEDSDYIYHGFIRLP